MDDRRTTRHRGGVEAPGGPLPRGYASSRPVNLTVAGAFPLDVTVCSSRESELSTGHGDAFGLRVGVRGGRMDRRHQPGPTDRTPAATQGEVHTGDRAREQAAVSASVASESGPTPRETASNGAERRRAGGIDADREGGRFRRRPVMPSWRRRTMRDVLA